LESPAKSCQVLVKSTITVPQEVKKK